MNSFLPRFTSGRTRCSAQDLLADDPYRLEVRLDRVEVEQRRAELVGRGNGDLARVGHVVLDEVAYDADAAFLRRRDRIYHRRIGDQAVGDQPLGQALQAGPCVSGVGNRQVVHCFEKANCVADIAPNLTVEVPAAQTLGEMGLC